MFERLDDLRPGAELASLLASVEIATLDDDDTMAFLRACRRQQAWTESLLLSAAAEFAQRRDTVSGSSVPGSEALVQIGGAGAPRCGSFAADELGPELRMSRHSAARLLADAVDLAFRLPRLLQAVRHGETDAWRARMVAGFCRPYSAETAADVEARLAHRLDRLTRSDIVRIVDQVAAVAEPEVREQDSDDAAETRHVTLDSSRSDHIDLFARLQAGWALRLDARVDQIADMLAVVHPEHGETKDQRRARAMAMLADPQSAIEFAQHYQAICRAEPECAPRDRNPFTPITLYVHLRQDGVIDLERYGVHGLRSLQDLLDRCQVTVKPVMDLAHLAPSSGYQPSDTLREGIILANPRCCFPYCDGDSRKSQIDHVLPWPHGDTDADNLGPPCPRHHRVKTHADWELRQPFRGIFIWRSPTGRIYVTDGRETLPLAA